MSILERFYLIRRLSPQLENENMDERGYTILPFILINSYSASLV